MNSLKRFFKTSILYLLGNILTRAMSFIMVPLYTYYISPNDYGTYNYIISIMTFFATFCYFDIWSGVLRFFFDYNRIEDQNKCIFNGLIIFAISSGIYLVCFITFNHFKTVPYFILVLATGILGNIQNIYTYLARGYKENRLFVICGLISSLIYFSSNYILLVHFLFDYSSIYISTIVSSICNILMLEYFLEIRKKFLLSFFDKKIFINILIYSLPLAFNSSASWLLGSYNQIAVMNVLSAYDNGIYALANKFSAAIYFFTSCFQLAWQEISFDSAGSKSDSGNFYLRAVDGYLKAMLLGVLILCPVIYFIYPFFVNISYNASLILIPFTILQAAISAVSAFLGNIFAALKRTKYLFITFLSAGFLNVGLLYFFLPTYGIQIVNIILSVCMLIVVILRSAMLKRYISLKFDFKFIIIFSFLFLLMYYGFRINNTFLILFNFLVACLWTLILIKNFHSIIEE